MNYSIFVADEDEDGMWDRLIFSYKYKWEAYAKAASLSRFSQWPLRVDRRNQNELLPGDTIAVFCGGNRIWDINEDRVQVVRIDQP